MTTPRELIEEGRKAAVIVGRSDPEQALLWDLTHALEKQVAMWDELRERMEWLRARNARRYTEGEDDGKAIAEACLMALESMGDIETRQTLKDAYKRMEESEPVQDDPQEIERRVKEMRGKTDE
jgi:hypothetical protein